MTDPFPGLLLESWVIVDKRWKYVTDLRFIDDNSRLEKITGKSIRHALEDIVGLKQAAFQRLANTARRDFLFAKKIFERCWGSPCKPSTSRLQISTRVACYARTHIYDAAQRVLRGLVVSFGRYWQKEFCSLIFISNRYPPPYCSLKLIDLCL